MGVAGPGHYFALAYVCVHVCVGTANSRHLQGLPGEGANCDIITVLKSNWIVTRFIVLYVEPAEDREDAVALFGSRVCSFLSGDL